MARFHPLYVRRSDGVLEGTQKKREKNEPTADQLDPTPDKKGVSDYYRLLSKNDAKHLDWRRKLGGMLIREVGGKEHPASGMSSSCIRYRQETNKSHRPGIHSVRFP